MLPPEIVELAEKKVPFRDRRSALARLAELAEDPAEMLALAQLAPQLAEAIGSCADADHGLMQLARFVQARGWRLPLYHLFGDHPAALDSLVRVLAASRYLADVLVRNPEFFEVVSDSAILSRCTSAADLLAELAHTCAPFGTNAARLDAVRRFRRREILRIGAADLLALADLRQTTEQLSHLAAAIVQQCLSIVGNGKCDGLIVLALGKLGGGELNYSSDIDLIFLADQEAHVAGATKLARDLTAALGNSSGEGFLYRVDLRLRPYGASGALVVSADTFLEYLSLKGHPAERQAMLKARVVAGHSDAGGQFLQRVAPLLSADAAAARQQVRHLKDRIERQLRSRRQAERHVKLAPGGIRDIEFAVQALQLEAVAERPDLAIAGTLDALASLARAGVIDKEDAETFREAYVFHRLVEHRLQLMENRQVHRLPHDPVELRLVARSLAFAAPDEGSKLQSAYEARALAVREIFERVLDVGQVSDLSKSATGQVENLSYEQLLDRVRRAEDVELITTRDGHVQWTVTVAAHDHLGLLSLLAGLFAAHGIDIARGDVATIRKIEAANTAGRRRKGRQPTSSAPRCKILDVFHVQTQGWVDREFWDDFRRELVEVVGLLAAGNAEDARDRVIERVSQSLRASLQPQPPLSPVSVEVDNDVAPDATVLRIRATNTVGFLFQFASALATLDVNIQRVEIRTIQHEVRDTFWVTAAAGGKIIDEERIHELRVAAALIKQFTHLLPQSPDPALALKQFSALARQILSRPEWVEELTSLTSESVLRTLAEVMGVSQFLWEDFLRQQHENLFPVLRNIPALESSKSPGQLARELSELLRGRDLDEQTRLLNEFKDREMFRIDLRHITRRIGLEKFSAELSDLADAIVATACDLCHARLAQQFGGPRLDDARPCGWCICGLGKLGGRELGFASDIELIFVYERDGKTSGPDSISNSRYFEEFVSQFLRTLTARREGVFEIDLRLRPYGKAGTLACSLEGFRSYFAPQGAAQQFERLALVKLRPVAGNPDLASAVLTARDAFVYSPQPLDYGNIRHLRDRQAAELVPSRQISAKRSLGGLVDLEYFVQSRQIEVGRADAGVRVPSTLEAIERLQQAGALSASVANELADAYRFQRRLIEALRVVRGHAKDLTIPHSGTLAFTHLARRLGHESPVTLAQEIDRRMSFASKVWELRRP